MPEGATPEATNGATPAVDAQTTETVAPQGVTIPDPEGAESLGDPGKKALEAMKAQVRDAKSRANELENELKSLRNGTGQSSESVESRVKTAVAEATARAHFEAAVSNAGLELDESMMDFFKVEKFVSGGKADKAAINDFVGRFAPKAPEKKFAQGVGVGPQSNGKAGQLTRDDMNRMTPAQINQARKEGKFDALMRGQI
jgi:hypothetical protein